MAKFTPDWLRVVAQPCQSDIGGSMSELERCQCGQWEWQMAEMGVAERSTRGPPLRGLAKLYQVTL
jgi:hypothetical protein